MPASWQDVDLDFDTAAERFVRRHQTDGAARDLPVLDLRTWGVSATPDGERFTLRPLAGHEAPLPLRSTAFSGLCTRLGAPAEFIRDRLPAPLQLATLNFLMAQGERSWLPLLSIIAPVRRGFVIKRRQHVVVVLDDLFVLQLGVAERRFASCVADGSVPSQPFFEHAEEHRYFAINVVEDPNLALAGV